MNETIVERILINDKNLRSQISSYPKKRYLFDELKKLISGREEFIGYYGLRGIGKTVLMLQLAERFQDSIYISADATYLKNTSLYELVHYFDDFKFFFIDEIHLKSGWTKDLKTLFDEKKGIRIVFTGSSSLNIRKGVDLSRRVIYRELRPASFREYLNIKKNYDFKVLKLKDIIKNKRKLISEFLEVKKYLDEYYREGGFLVEYEESIYDNILQKMIYEDLAYQKNINVKVENDVYKILNKIAMSEPYEINYSNIANYLETNKNSTIALIDGLCRIEIITRLHSKKIGTEPKIYLPIPIRSFLCKLLGVQPKIGSLREDFIVMHLNPDNYVKSDYLKKTPDFIKDNASIEAGGLNKKTRQGADYRIIDGVETKENRIPMVLFGFLY